jgi:hypothetical protein
MAVKKIIELCLNDKIYVVSGVKKVEVKKVTSLSLLSIQVDSIRIPITQDEHTCFVLVDHNGALNFTDPELAMRQREKNILLEIGLYKQKIKNKFVEIERDLDGIETLSKRLVLSIKHEITE